MRRGKNCEWKPNYKSTNSYLAAFVSFNLFFDPHSHFGWEKNVWMDCCSFPDVFAHFFLYQWARYVDIFLPSHEKRTRVNRIVSGGKSVRFVETHTSRCPCTDESNILAVDLTRARMIFLTLTFRFIFCFYLTCVRFPSFSGCPKPNFPETRSQKYYTNSNMRF